MTFSDSNTEEGGYVVKPIYMETYSGRRFDPTAMGLIDIDLGDIAHALALQNRYNGHTAGPISVARHSLWVAESVWDATYRYDLAFIGLMHDASEAYLGDIIRPLKHRPWAAGYLEVERHVEELIAERFGFAFPYPPEIKAADEAITGGRERFERKHWQGDWRYDKEQFLNTFTQLDERRGR